jgi:dTDP-4-amino-4,6-dideoxygalactose transaminase
MSLKKYKEQIASILGCNSENIFLYWKGRIALYAFLKSLNLKPGDEVIIPAFTCVVVPNAILYAGLKPVYVDILSSTYNMDFQQLEKNITAKTRVIICQNTFGLSSNLEEIISIAKKYNLYTIEDCTHGFGGYYNGKPNGSYCDAAFYSTQWNKPFSTGIGGFLVVNNNNLLKNIDGLEKIKLNPKLIEKSVLRFLLVFRKLFVNKYTLWPLVKFYRFLSKKNLTVGSNSGEELSTIVIPNGYFKDISKVQISAGLKSLKNISMLNELRKKNAHSYTEFLKSKNKNHVDPDLFPNHIFLKYPLLVKNREQFFEFAKNFRVTLGDWFLSPLHPIKDDLTKWGLDRRNFPVADYTSQRIVNLPTDIINNKGVLEFLKQNLDSID